MPYEARTKETKISKWKEIIIIRALVNEIEMKKINKTKVSLGEKILIGKPLAILSKR